MRNLSFWVLLVLAALVATSILVVQRDHRQWRGLEDVRRGPLRIGYAIEPPGALIDAQGRVGGEAPELLRAVLRRLGDAEPVWLHFERPALIDALQAGHIDVVANGPPVTPELQQQVAFTRPTLIRPTEQVGHPAFALRKDDPLLGRLDQGLADWLGSATAPGSVASPSAIRHE